MRFASPEAFLLLLLLPPAMWLSLRPRHGAVPLFGAGKGIARRGSAAVWGPPLLLGLRPGPRAPGDRPGPAADRPRDEHQPHGRPDHRARD